MRQSIRLGWGMINGSMNSGISGTSMTTDSRSRDRASASAFLDATLAGRSSSSGDG